MLSIHRQCELLSLSRSGYYYIPVEEDRFNLELMRRIDEQYTRTPFYGVRRMTAWLIKQVLSSSLIQSKRL
jgi:putative transposase